VAGDFPEDVNGSRATAAVLERLPRAQWRVLHDVPWPGRPRTTIDHVVVGPAGVFVVDAKNWSGKVVVRGGVLKLDRHSRQGAVTHAAEAAHAIAAQLRSARCPVSPVLCLVRDETIAADCQGVLVCTTANIMKLLDAREPVLADAQVQRLAGDLVGHRLPVVKPPVTPSRGRTARGVTYLVGALAALGAAIVLVSRPDLVTQAVEDVTKWVAESIEDAG